MGEYDVDDSERETPPIPDLDITMDQRTTITAYKPEVKIMRRAKRKLEREYDQDITLHTALMMICKMYLNGTIDGGDTK